MNNSGEVPVTHQAIFDRLEQLDGDAHKAQQEVLKQQHPERKSLEELCGGLGHIYGSAFGGLKTITEDRYCMVCRCVDEDRRQKRGERNAETRTLLYRHLFKEQA